MLVEVNDITSIFVTCVPLATLSSSQPDERCATVESHNGSCYTCCQPKCTPLAREMTDDSWLLLYHAALNLRWNHNCTLVMADQAIEHLRVNATCPSASDELETWISAPSRLSRRLVIHLQIYVCKSCIVADNEYITLRTQLILDTETPSLNYGKLASQVSVLP